MSRGMRLVAYIIIGYLDILWFRTPGYLLAVAAGLLNAADILEGRRRHDPRS